MTDPTDSDSTPNQPNQLPSSDSPPPPLQEPKPSPRPETPATSGLHFPAMGQSQTMNEKDEKLWAMMGHLLSLTGLFTAIGYVIGPLIPFLMKKGESPFVDEHSRETLNFSILTFIVVFASGTIGFAACFVWLITAMMAVLNLIFCIQGALAAKSGEAYRYPFNWRIIK